MRWYREDGVCRYVRAIGHLSNGVDPMEPNTDFPEELEKAAGPPRAALSVSLTLSLQCAVSYRLQNRHRLVVLKPQGSS